MDNDDYNDNDFEGHNLQLAGEESSKFSSELRPFTLPKFDYGDSIHGHLRFDSLVENEVFLGIPSQDDDQWIEDFSRGSSVIGFSSRATESCALPKRNNVWSEVTSTESVEMLLNAVGEEEMLPGKRVVEESDPGDNKLGSSIKRMESNLSQDDNIDTADCVNLTLKSDSSDKPDCSIKQMESNLSQDGNIDTVDCVNPSLESDLGEQPGSPMKQIESSLSQGDNIDAVDCINPSLGSDPGDRSPIRKIESKHDDKFNDVDCDFPSLRPVELDGKYSRLNLSERVEGVCTEYTVQTQEGIFASHEVCVADKESRISLDIDRTSTSGNPGETFELFSDSLSDKLQQNIDVHDMDIRTKESFSNKITASVGDSGDQNKVSDISFVSSCCLSKGIAEGVMEQNVINTNDESLAGNTAETVSSEMLCALEIASEVNDSKEEHAVHLPNIGEIVSMPEMVDSVSTVERSSDDAFVVGPSDDNEYGTMALSSCTRINQLSEEIFDKSYRTSEGEGYIKGAVNSTSFDNAELNKVPATQPLDQPKSVGDEDVFLGNKSSLEASSDTFKFPIFATLSSPSELDFDSNANHADGPGNSIGSSFAGEYCEEESVIEDTRDVKGATLIQNEHGSPQTCVEDVPPRETYHQCSLDDFDCEKDDNTLPLGSKNMVSDNKEIPGEGAKNAERATESLSSTPSRDSKVFNTVVEDTTRAASEIKVAKVPNISTPKKSFEVAAEVAPAIYKATQLDNAATEEAKMGDLSVSLAETFSSSMPIETTKVSYDITKDSADDLISFKVAFEVTPAIDKATQLDNAATEETKMGDLSVPLAETFNGTMPTEATKDSNDKLRDSASDLISFGVAAEVSPAIFKATQLDYTAIEGTKTADLSVTLAETFSGPMPIEATKHSNEKIKESAIGLILQNDDSEAAHTEKSMEAVIKNCSQTNSSVVSVSSCPVEIDESDKLSAPVIECTELPQNQSNNNVENVGEFLSTSMNAEVNAISKAEGTFTFDIKPLGGQSVLEPCKGVQSFSEIQACKHSLTREGSLLAPISNQKDMMIVKEISDANSLLSSDGVRSSGDVKVKKRRGRGKHGNESAKKGNLLKETTPIRQKECGDKSSLSPLGAGQLLKVDHAVKPKGAISIPTSSLPDLNTYSPSSSLFQQPFKDLQQVQLRAQIFVYGSLIQGAAPDEAFMVSAFDGGRSIWEPSWRACVERLHGQKKKGNHTETQTPLNSRSGAKAPGQSTTKGSTQTEVLFSPASRAINKATPSSLSPIIPLSSPLWNITTPSCEGLPSSSIPQSAIFDYQAFSPIHPYQTTPVGNFVAHTTSKSSQARFPVSWISSSQSSPFDIGAKYSTFSNTEPVKLTPVKDSSLAISSPAKHGSLVPLFNSGATTMSTGTSSLVDLKNTPTDTKSRKRKKSSGVGKIPIDASTASAPTGTNCSPKNISAMKDLSRISVNAQNQDSVSTPVPSCHYSTSIAGTTPCLVPKETFNQFFSVASPSISSDHLERADVIKDKMTLNLETFSKVEEAKLHAEEAASFAATTVNHCQAMWSQLNQQKNSGLTSDVEARLASAAVAIAAAAAVAKVAAAAAKIASSAAVQAKQMADEAVTMLGSEHNTNVVSNLVKNTGGASPVSIMQGGNLGLSTAKETAKKRIKAASAATKHAENLDAIVKAAELAAEAVSHTGIIVGMEDPFSLTHLVEAGPDGYWKSSHGIKTNDMNRSKFTCGIVGEVPTVCPSLHEGPDTDDCDAVPTVPPTQSEAPKNILGEHAAGEGSLIAPKKQGEKNLELWKDKSASDSAKCVGIVSEPDVGSMSTFTFANSNGNTSIIEGSAVEVLKDGLHSKKAWFSANILSLKDGKALVCYRELQSSEGSEQLKEWITLEPQDGEAPIIRVPHPMNAVQFDGTKKRRRAASTDYTWSVGDKVDAWVQDSWREGIVAEKYKKDATSLTVHFPAQGETVTLKVWHLRPTVIWVDGQWIEWCRPRQDATSQGDTPLEKRQKLQSDSMEAKGKGKIAENINLVEERGAKEPILPLSAKEKEFSIGSMRDQKLPNMPRTMRSGLQKEGSRVVFGVPKPGKKRKFMDVSKHYVSDGSTKTSNDPNDSVKLSKYSAAQGSLSKGLKSNLKVDLKEQAAESKPKVLKSCKPPIPTRKLPRKEDSTTSSQSGEQNLAEFGSSSNVEATSKGTTVFSSRAFPPESRKASRKNNAKPDRLNKEKLILGSWKSVKSESNQTLIPEVTEPRRSVRRIQPTSRLLEGLQSSLMVQKTPSSNDKSHKSFLMKGSSRGNNNHS